MSLHFSRESQSLVEHLGKAALFRRPFYFCRLRSVTPSRVWRASSACHCAAFRMPSLTGPHWRPDRGRALFASLDTQDADLFIVTSIITTFAVLRRVVRRGSPRPSASAIPAGATCRISLFGGPPVSRPQHEPVGPRCRNLGGEHPCSDASTTAAARGSSVQCRGVHLGRKTRIKLSFLA